MSLHSLHLKFINTNLTPLLFPSAYLHPQICLPLFLTLPFILSFQPFSSILPLLPRSTASALNSSRSRPLNTMDPLELKRVFQMFDRNGDGRITHKELNDSLDSLGIFIPHKDLTQMIDKIDVNGDGCVDMDEFGELYKAIMEERNEEEDMREAFGVFDQNSDGFITVDELRSVLSSLGLKQGRAVEDCRKMIMKVDVDGDGRVNYSEFKQMMKGGGFGALG